MAKNCMLIAEQFREGIIGFTGIREISWEKIQIWAILPVACHVAPPLPPIFF